MLGELLGRFKGFLLGGDFVSEGALLGEPLRLLKGFSFEEELRPPLPGEVVTVVLTEDLPTGDDVGPSASACCPGVNGQGLTQESSNVYWIAGVCHDMGGG